MFSIVIRYYELVTSLWPHMSSKGPIRREERVWKNIILRRGIFGESLYRYQGDWMEGIHHCINTRYLCTYNSCSQRKLFIKCLQVLLFSHFHSYYDFCNFVSFHNSCRCLKFRTQELVVFHQDYGDSYFWNSCNVVKPKSIID